MILQGVSVITMDANSGTALDSVINEAKRAGIPVIAFDQAVKNRYALSVTVDHYTWATRYARMDRQDAEREGQGRRHGRHSRQSGRRDPTPCRARHLWQISRHRHRLVRLWHWDHAKAQSVMATVIAAQPQIDGAFVEDSMGLGFCAPSRMRDGRSR